MLFRQNQMKTIKNKTKRSLLKTEVFFSSKLGGGQKKKRLRRKLKCFFVKIRWRPKKKKRSSLTVEVFFLLNHFSRGIWCYIRPDFVGLFPLIIQRSNLIGGTPKSRWGDVNSWYGDASPSSPLQFKYCLVVQPTVRTKVISWWGYSNFILVVS